MIEHVVSVSKNKTRRATRDRDPYQAREAKKYANPIPSREFILSLMEDHGAPLRFDDLAEALKLADPQQLDALSRRMNAMARDGQVAVSYTHLTLPTNIIRCRSRWSPYH
mgnify:CR=1 FL=1